MAHASETLEHAQHIAHGGGHDGHEGSNRLGTAVGITMAILGVLLAFSAAKVGGERTELTQALVDQEYAHGQFEAQDIKHRVAILALQNLHAEAEVGRTNANDMMLMADTADRSQKDAAAASTWVDDYDPLIEAYVESQEHYERAQLAAEFGIVIASIALLLKKKWPWFASLALGILAIVLLVMTYTETREAKNEHHEKIEVAEKTYETMREENETTTTDKQLIDEVRRDYGAGHAVAPASAPAPAPAAGSAGSAGVEH